MKKIAIFIMFTMIMVGIFAPCKLKAQTKPVNTTTTVDTSRAQKFEFGYILLSNISDIKSYDIGEQKMIALLATCEFTAISPASKSPTLVGKEVKVYIEDNEENRRMLSSRGGKGIWVDFIPRTFKDGNWGDPVANDAINLIYNWGEILDWPNGEEINLSDFKRFSYLRLSHIVKRYVTFKSEDTRQIQILSTKLVQTKDGKIFYEKNISYLDDNPTNQEIFNFTNAIFTNSGLMVREGGKWVELSLKNAKLPMHPVLFNFGNKGQLENKPLLKKANQTQPSSNPNNTNDENPPGT